MKLRIKTLARDKGMTMQDIAKQLGINPVNFSNSINKNPTLKRLEEVASVLGVRVSELFDPQPQNSIQGYVEFNGHIHKINNLQDLKDITKQAEDYSISIKELFSGFDITF